MSKNIVLGLLCLLFVLTIIVIYFLIYNPIEFDWKYWGGDTPERSAVLRNLSVFPIAIIGMGLALWRSVIAEGQKRNTEIGLDLDRLQHAISHIASDKTYVRMMGLKTLENIARKNVNLKPQIIATIYDFAQVRSKDVFDNDLKIEKSNTFALNELEITPNDINIAFQILVSLKKLPSFEQGEYFTYQELCLRGVQVGSLSDANFYKCDLRNSRINALKGISFIQCDLSMARVNIKGLESADIFSVCNVSGIKLEVPDCENPRVNGWHWEGCPPMLAADWSYPTWPKDRRIIGFDEIRIFPSSEENGHHRLPFSIPESPDFTTFLREDKLLNYTDSNLDLEQQTIVQDKFVFPDIKDFLNK